MNNACLLLAILASSCHGAYAFRSPSSPAVQAPTNIDTLDRVQQWSMSSPVIEEAFDVLCNGGTLLCPTNVGYSLFTLDGKEGMANLDKVKGREEKPYGIVGSETTFTRVFRGLKAPSLKNEFCSDTMISFVSSESVSEEVREQLRMSRAVGKLDEVAMWINSGPVFDTIIDKVEAKYKGKRLILVTSGNISGQGNPKSSTFSIDAVDDELLARVDMVVDIPHWSVPDLDEDGRWLSAPMFHLDTSSFCRVGKNMERANVIASLFKEIDTDGSNAIDIDEFNAFVKSGRLERILPTFLFLMKSLSLSNRDTDSQCCTLSSIMLESAALESLMKVRLEK